MQLTIMFMDHNKSTTIDIMVNECQAIRDTIAIINESGRVRNIARPIASVQSMRTKKYLDLGLSYAEQGIYYGDILQIKKQ